MMSPAFGYELFIIWTEETTEKQKMAKLLGLVLWQVSLMDWDPPGSWLQGAESQLAPSWTKVEHVGHWTKLWQVQALEMRGPVPWLSLHPPHGSSASASLPQTRYVLTGTSLL